jgi:hypothetical protein
MPGGTLPTGAFSSLYAGRVKMTLSAEFFANSYSDVGFPSSGGGNGNLSIKGFILTDSGYVYTPIIDKFSATAYVEVDYPGGAVSWPCGVMENAFKSPGSLYTVGFHDLRFLVTFQKR